MSSSEPAIEADAVTKAYGDVRAVDSLDLTVECDETYGFLGPNGADKSTTIGLVLDYLRPTSGGVRVLGKDPRRKDEVISSSPSRWRGRRRDGTRDTTSDVKRKISLRSPAEVQRGRNVRHLRGDHDRSMAKSRSLFAA